MDYSEEQIALFDQFIADEMSLEEKSSFEQRLISEPLFKEKFDQYQALKGGIELHAIGDLFAKMEQWDEAVDQVDNKSIGSDHLDHPPESSTDETSPKLGLFSQVEHPGNTRFGWKKALSIAASFILAGFFMWQYDGSTSGASAPPEGFEHYPSNIHIKRSATNDIPLKKQKAYNLYEIKEYKLAAPLLQTYYEESNELDALFYAGVSYMALGKLEKARKIFGSQQWSETQAQYINKTLPQID